MPSEVKMPVVAWQCRRLDPEEGPGDWGSACLQDLSFYSKNPTRFELRPLVSDADAIAYADALAEQRVREMEARKDAAYLERNRVVAALASCFPSGIARTAIEGWSEDWHGCVYIDLPTGQASWHYHDSHAHLFEHLPPYPGKWDGHTTEEKYDRIRALAQETKNG